MNGNVAPLRSLMLYTQVFTIVLKIVLQYPVVLTVVFHCLVTYLFAIMILYRVWKRKPYRIQYKVIVILSCHLDRINGINWLVLCSGLNMNTRPDYNRGI